MGNKTEYLISLFIIVVVVSFVTAVGVGLWWAG